MRANYHFSKGKLRKFPQLFLPFFFLNENENKEDCKDEGRNLFIHFHSESKAINVLSLSLGVGCFSFAFEWLLNIARWSAAGGSETGINTNNRLRGLEIENNASEIELYFP